MFIFNLELLQTLKNAKRGMDALTAMPTTSSRCSSDFPEIEPEENELQSSAAVLAENSSPGFDENDTDSVNELHELVRKFLKLFKRVHVLIFLNRGLKCNATGQLDSV